MWFLAFVGFVVVFTNILYMNYGTESGMVLLPPVLTTCVRWLVSA